MKAVILAGGFGTRISEESRFKPKPMVEIGNMPILWHIMKIYSHYGVKDFVICAGYKQEIIKEWFSNYFIHTSDVTFDFTGGNELVTHRQNSEKWRVTVIDTGLNTMTGGRLKRIENHVRDEAFFLTYGDGVSDVNMKELLKHHKKSGKIATLTCVRPESRYGFLDCGDDGTVLSLREKDPVDSGWINAGFMVMEPEALDYMCGDEEMLEKEPFDRMIRNHVLGYRKHFGYWQCMDTVREKQQLENIWKSGRAPWMVWEDNEK